MNQSLAQFLNEQQADAATVQHAVRYLVSELSNDIPPEVMQSQLAQAVDDAAPVEEAIAILGTDSAALLDANLAVLSALWDDPKHRDSVRDAIAQAKNRLPIVEVTVIAACALYGLYLVTTGGKRREVRKTIKRPDGSWEESVKIEFADAKGPLRALGGILARFMGE